MIITVRYNLTLSELASKEPSEWVGRLRGLDFSEGVLGNFHMRGSIGEFIVNLDADSVLVQNIRHTSWEEPKSCRNK